MPQDSLMYKKLITFVFLALIISPLSIGAELPTVPFVVAKGEANMEVPPDKATIKLQVVAFEKESEAAVAIVQQQVTRVLEVLVGYEIPDAAITSFSLRKDVERARQDYRDLEILGYYVSRRITVEVNDLSRFGDLVAALAEIDNVSSLDANFEIKDRVDIEAQLTREAADDAKRKAKNMADGMGVSIGNVYAISETEFRLDRTIFGLGQRLYADMAVSSPYADTVFLPTTINIRQSLSVIFEIEQ